MLHKIFQWWYLKTRSSYGLYSSKFESRTNERDLMRYYHDFGGDGMNSRRSYWLYRIAFKTIFWTLFLTAAVWFAYESYHGLMIYDD
jgi:hypothetical protein